MTNEHHLHLESYIGSLCPLAILLPPRPQLQKFSAYLDKCSRYNVLFTFNVLNLCSIIMSHISLVVQPEKSLVKKKDYEGQFVL